MKTTQEQVDDLTAKVFRLEAIATRLSKAEKQLAELTRNDSWLADRCKDAADRLAKLESGKAEVQDGGELGKIRNTVGTYARGIGLDRMPTSGVVGYLLHAYYGLKNARELTVTALGTDYDDEETIAGNVARVRRKLSDAQRERDALRASVVAEGGEVYRLRAALDSQREEIVKYHARVAKLEDELRERISELSAAQRLIAEAYNIDDDVMAALGDPVKGAEAEELQRGIRDLIKAADSNDGVVSWHALQSLLDRVNARDSNAFLAHLERAETGKPVPCHRCNASDSERLYFWTCRECLNAQSEKLVDKLDRTLTALAISTSEREEAEARLVEATKTVEARLYRGAHDSITGNREALGRIVRWVWIAWAKEQPNPKPSWLVPWEGLSEPDKEVDRRIGERLAAEGLAILATRIIVTPDKAAALREAGWEKRVSGWSPDGGYSAWTLDGAYDAMVAARGKAPGVADDHAALVAFAADLAAPRDTMTQPEPGDLYVDKDNGEGWLCIHPDLITVDKFRIKEANHVLRPATPEEAAKIRKDNGL